MKTGRQNLATNWLQLMATLMVADSQSPALARQHAIEQRREERDTDTGGDERNRSTVNTPNLA